MILNRDPTAIGGIPMKFSRIEHLKTYLNSTKPPQINASWGRGDTINLKSFLAPFLLEKQEG